MKKQSHSIDVIFVLVIFCILAVSLLIVLMTGAQSYNGIKDSMEEQYSEYTCVNYIATKIRHNDTAGDVYMDSLKDGTPALCLVETHGTEKFVTYIYHHDGYVKEMFTFFGNDFDPNMGSKIVEVESLNIETNGSLVSISCTADSDRSASVGISLRSMEVAG